MRSFVVSTVAARAGLSSSSPGSASASSGAWTPDADCTSGCNIGGLSYCQKFWPNTTSIRQVSVSSKPASAWANAGCYPANDEYDGSDEFECVVD